MRTAADTSSATKEACLDIVKYALISILDLACQHALGVPQQQRQQLISIVELMLWLQAHHSTSALLSYRQPVAGPFTKQAKSAAGVTSTGDSPVHMCTSGCQKDLQYPDRWQPGSWNTLLEDLMRKLLWPVLSDLSRFQSQVGIRQRIQRLGYFHLVLILAISCQVDLWIGSNLLVQFLIASNIVLCGFSQLFRRQCQPNRLQMINNVLHSAQHDVKHLAVASSKQAWAITREACISFVWVIPPALEQNLQSEVAVAD